MRAAALLRAALWLLFATGLLSWLPLCSPRRLAGMCLLLAAPATRWGAW